MILCKNDQSRGKKIFIINEIFCIHFPTLIQSKQIKQGEKKGEKSEQPTTKPLLTEPFDSVIVCSLEPVLWSVIDDMTH